MSPLFQIEKIAKIYAHGGKTVQALQDVSLTIDAGDIFGIIGQSGAGKSTLIRMLARLIAPTSGKILFHSADIAHLEGDPLKSYRKKIGMIFQHFNLLSSRTVAGNIAYPLEVAHVPNEVQDARIDELLGLVGLKDKKFAYPSHLSGGEKQRVGIARALANHPEILLCDEATSALDPKTTREILDLLKSINQKLGLTIFLITHEMEVIKRLCNKVAVIHDGQIVEQGSVVQIFTDPQHATTREFLQSTAHEIPPEFFKEISDKRKLLRLRFKGKSTGEPVITQIVRKYDVDANILLGWIDNLQTTVIGTLIIDLTGTPENIVRALAYLKEQSVQCEVLEKNER